MKKETIKRCWEKYLLDEIECPTGVILTIARHFIPICRKQGNTPEETLDRLMYALDWEDREDAESLVSCIDENGHYHIVNALRFWSVYPKGFTHLRKVIPDNNSDVEDLLMNIRKTFPELSNNCKQLGENLVITSSHDALYFVCGPARLQIRFVSEHGEYPDNILPCPVPEGLVFGRPLIFHESGNKLLSLLENRWGLWPGYLKAELSGFV